MAYRQSSPEERIKREQQTAAAARMTDAELDYQARCAFDHDDATYLAILERETARRIDADERENEYVNHNRNGAIEGALI